MDYNNLVLVTKDYDKIDGREAYQSQTKMLSLEHVQKNKGQPNKIIAKVWKSENPASISTSVELLLHQVLDLAIFTCQGLVYFQDAYRFPKFYDPENTCVERIGLQGSSMPVLVCVDNSTIDKDIQKFSQAINDDSEMIGERLRALSLIMKEMGY